MKAEWDQTGRLSLASADDKLRDNAETRDISQKDRIPRIKISI